MIKSIKKTLAVIFIVFSLNTIYGLTQPIPSTQTSEIKDISLSLIKEITLLKLSNPVILYEIFNFIELFLHECGHGLTSMSFASDSFEDIHLLCSPQNWNTHTPLINLGKLKIHGNGLARLTHFNYDFKEKYKNLLRLIAGPLTGLFICHLALFGVNFYAQYSDKKEIIQSAKSSLSKLYSPFKTILNAEHLSIKSKRFLLNLSFVASFSLIKGLFYGATPNCYGLSGLKLGSYRNAIGDGVGLWKEFILDKNQLSWLNDISIGSAVLEWCSYVYLLIKYANGLVALGKIPPKE
jgi:hypothetical protein